MSEITFQKEEWITYSRILGILRNDRKLFECQFSEEEKELLLNGLSELKDQIIMIFETLDYLNFTAELGEKIRGFLFEYISIKMEIKKMLIFDNGRLLKREHNHKKLEKLKRVTLAYRRDDEKLISFEDWFYKFEKKECCKMISPLQKYDDIEAKRRKDYHAELRKELLQLQSQGQYNDDYMISNWFEPWVNPRIINKLNRKAEKTLQKKF